MYCGLEFLPYRSRQLLRILCFILFGHRMKIFLLPLLALFGGTPCLPSILAQEAAEETRAATGEPLADRSSDGWNELWLLMHPGITHRDKTTDTDGDGMSDYEEMLAWRDPFVKGPVDEPREPLTPEQIAEAAKAAEMAEADRKAAMARRKEQLAPYVVKPLVAADGKASSRREIQSERKQKLAALAERKTVSMKLAREAAEARVRQAGLDPTFIGPDGRVSGVAGSESGGFDFNVTYNTAAADTISTDEVHAGGSLGLTLGGSGRIIGIWEGGDVLTSHSEFTVGTVRAIDKDGANTVFGIDNHATHVAGTMMAAGLVTSAKGMSPAATLHAYDWDSDFAEMATAAIEDDLRLSNHSYGFQRGWGTISVGGTTFMAWWGDTTISAIEDYRFGYYDDFAQAVDEIAYGAPHYLSVWAAGNERGGSGAPGINPANGYYAFNGTGFDVSFLVRPNDYANDGGYDLLEGRGVAKNNLTVSAVEDIVGGYTSPTGVVVSSFSSFGPPDDGRIKPDIAANGVSVFSTLANGSYGSSSGTSMAAPAVTGSLNLLLEHYENLFGSIESLRASTLKAITLHSADEAGSAVGPDYRFGWGLMNTKSAAQLITAHHAVREALTHVKQILLNDGDFIEFPVVAIGGTPMKVTICWTDPAGIVPPKALDVNVAALVNDLDLRILGGGITYFPWKLDPATPTAAATNGADNDRDTVEQVFIATPTADQTYTVRVTHKGTLVDDTSTTAPQVVSMIITGVKPEPEPIFEVKETVQTGEGEFTLTWSSVVGADYQIETTDDLNTPWVEIPGEINATKPLTAVVVETAPGDAKRFWRVKRL